jgi:chloride channel 2
MRVEKREFAREFSQLSCPDQTRTRAAWELITTRVAKTLINSHQNLDQFKVDKSWSNASESCNHHQLSSTPIFVWPGLNFMVWCCAVCSVEWERTVVCYGIDMVWCLVWDLIVMRAWYIHMIYCSLVYGIVCYGIWYVRLLAVLWYCMVWCGMVWYGMVWYGVSWYMVLYGI